MTALIEFTVEGLDEADRRLARLDPIDDAVLLEGCARLIQEQTRRRIREEKTSPDGAAWPANRTGTPILYRSAMLERSIDYRVSAGEAVIGTGLKYARIHQQGGTIVPKSARALAFTVGGRKVFTKKVAIPARPYLGLSGANRAEILDTAVRFVRARLGE